MGFCFAVSFYFSCNNKVSICNSVNYRYRVVVATAKVQIFKQITTMPCQVKTAAKLLLLPQRYKFSSKSQRVVISVNLVKGCCCYRKGTNFQANHNFYCCCCVGFWVVVATAKVQIFKQITTCPKNKTRRSLLLLLPQRYKFSSKSQLKGNMCLELIVVVATAKVQIFKQITTLSESISYLCGCCCYRKGTNFQANHNLLAFPLVSCLLLLPQRYKFSSKSQLFFALR